MRRDQYDPEEVTDNRPDQMTTPGQGVPGSTSTGTMRSSQSGSDVQQQAGEVAEKAQKQAAAVKDRAMEQAEVGKTKAASGLKSAAEQMRSRTNAAESEGPKEKVITRAADTMDKSAQYLEEHEPREMWDDFEKFVREHPMQAAAGALVAGLVVGRILR
jgi:ElaB/YqjD/DUF883 family membrane-anchored ribosome-binding protein